MTAIELGPTSLTDRRDLNVTYLRAGALQPAPRNPNVMDEAVFRRLVEFIRRVGFLVPIVVRPLAPGRWEIVDGHQRHRAALELGLETVPCVERELGVDDAALARMAVDHLRGGLDLAMVAAEMAGLRLAGWATEELALASGFADDEIADLLRAGPSDVEMSLIEDPPEDPPPSAGPTPGFVLEVSFDSAADLRRAKKALRRAGDGDLARGVLRLLEGE